MAEIISTARSAREALAQGLNALQADANSPPGFLQAAEPIAMAMGALHRIERSAGAELAAAAPQALDAVRQALAILQTQSTSDPRVLAILEIVAGSLGMVFSLTKAAKYGPAPQPVAAQAYAPPPPVQQPAPQPQYAQTPQPQYQQPAPQYAPQPQYQQPAPQYAPPPQYQQPVAPQAAPQPQYGQAPAHVAAQPQPAPQPAPAQYGAAQRDPFAGSQAAHEPPPWGAQPAAQPQPAAPAAQQGAGAEEIRQARLPQVDAELGTHSVSNFYKGLSGNDVVENGGLFVSTYNIPEIGQKLKVRVALPGGYEFEALGVVRWTREARESISTEISPPGFGLQFTSITAEGRNLVYRYVRNREPIFHDDL
jgi:hypothetical protein